ncbi:MAG: efflux RND transporter permease subunit, partial [Myxococcota bacterium]
MKITEMAVRRPVTGVMAFIALSILGFVTFSRLQLDMLPNLEFPVMGVITVYQGAGPESMELLVSRPMEEALSSVQNVENIYSTSSANVSFI